MAPLRSTPRCTLLGVTRTLEHGATPVKREGTKTLRTGGSAGSRGAEDTAFSDWQFPEAAKDTAARLAPKVKDNVLTQAEVDLLSGAVKQLGILTEAEALHAVGGFEKLSDSGKAAFRK